VKQVHHVFDRVTELLLLFGFSATQPQHIVFNANEKLKVLWSRASRIRLNNASRVPTPSLLLLMEMGISFKSLPKQWHSGDVMWLDTVW
jgi:hypothetical protein